MSWLRSILVGFCLLVCPTCRAMHAQEWHTMRYREDAPGIDENPLKGFVPYASSTQGPQSFPHSMEWFYLPLSSIVTAEDTYNWKPLESQLNLIAARGHQAVFRFYLDYPRRQSGIPTYLLTAGLKTFPYEDFDNASGGVRSVAPDYADPRLIACLIHFIRAFGTKYDGDPRIAYVTAGLFGFWGEWHVGDHPLPGEDSGWTMSQRNKDALLTEYHDSFRRTPVLVRYATVTPRLDLLRNFGFHDDSFLRDTIGQENWQFWRGLQDAGLATAWQMRPVGGEIYPQLQKQLWAVRPNPAGQDVDTAISTTHATWLLDDDLFRKARPATDIANALQAERHLGYTFYCAGSRLTQAQDGSIGIAVRVQNRGVAPLYTSWPVEIEALDVDLNILAQGHAAWPLSSLLPGQSSEWSSSLQGPVQGAKYILLRIPNPLPNGHSIAFANGEMGTTLPGWLTLDELGAR